MTLRACIISIMKIVATGRTRPYVIGCAIGALLLVALPISASLLNATQYGAVASTVQAVAVVPAIAIAALALTRDGHDKRVDRVLDLHKELHSSDIEGATVRLSTHLRRHGVDGKARPTSREELRHDSVLSTYGAGGIFTPIADLDLILRFCERADVARIANTVEPSLLVELIGRFAGWWNLAITGVMDEIPRSHLSELANWAEAFALKHQKEYPYLRNWGRNRNREFGYVADGGHEA
jgi:hypothetical protein